MQEEAKSAIILFLNALLDFFKQAKSFTKFLLVILLCGCVWLLNDSTEFIRSYRISHKIENIKEIESLINNPNVDSNTKKMLQELEFRIIHRESLLERLYLFFDEDQSSKKTVIPSAGIEQNIKTNSNSLNGFIVMSINFFLHIFSSAWLGVLIFVYSLYWTFKDRKKNIKTPIRVMLISVINILFFSILTFVLPKSSNEVINYLINALLYTVLQLILLIVLLPKIIEDKEPIAKMLKIEN